MDSLSLVPASGSAVGSFTPASSTVRRILVVTEPKAAGGYGPEKQFLPRHLRGFLVDYRDAETLGLCNGVRASTPTRLTPGQGEHDCLNSIPLLSEYQLILVPNERVRATMCEALPGLARHVYALDCFGSFCEETATEGAPVQSSPQTAGLAHWSTFLTQLSS